VITPSSNRSAGGDIGFQPAWPSSSADDRLSALAHELRGRLHVLALNTTVMLASAREPESELASGWLVERLNRQADALRSMHELMERLLDVQQTEHSSELRTAQVVDLRQIALELIRSDGESLRAARCSCTLQAPAAVFGYWDALQLRVALSNLLSNALKFGAGQPVEIAVGISEQRAFVRVTDRGPGIRPEDCERIFGRFQRASGSVRGTGVGLWLVSSIARAHGGEVNLRSTPGQGASFTISLPNPQPSAV
jgi:two-component system OmpR family sensor kinase